MTPDLRKSIQQVIKAGHNAEKAAEAMNAAIISGEDYEERRITQLTCDGILRGFVRSLALDYNKAPELPDEKPRLTYCVVGDMELDVWYDYHYDKRDNEVTVDNLQFGWHGVDVTDVIHDKYADQIPDIEAECIHDACRQKSEEAEECADWKYEEWKDKQLESMQ